MAADELNSSVDPAPQEQHIAAFSRLISSGDWSTTGHLYLLSVMISSMILLLLFYVCASDLSGNRKKRSATEDENKEEDEDEEEEVEAQEEDEAERTVGHAEKVSIGAYEEEMYDGLSEQQLLELQVRVQAELETTHPEADFSVRSHPTKCMGFIHRNLAKYRGDRRPSWNDESEE